MARRPLERIRDAILRGDYDMTHHALDEMVEDDLSIFDIEHAVLNGRITRIEEDDPRGPKYTVVGSAKDQRTEVGVVGRFTDSGTYLIITVYEVTAP